ncbi:MAG: GNAT family N-acetyltransferase [Actinobacteria bacterium]|nr:GNAT family N-acetyltransferase [Actinomycetota bacterium]
MDRMGESAGESRAGERRAGERTVDALTIASAGVEQQDDWRRLFTAYRAVAGLADDPGAVETVWSWICSPAHATGCLLASIGPAVVGLAHVRAFERPVTGTTGLWVDDLYVDPSARGRGVARALIARVRELAAQDGHDVVRWTTRESNADARRLYDTVATRADVVVYNAAPQRAARVPGAGTGIMAP